MPFSVFPGCSCLDLQKALRIFLCPLPAKALGIHPEAASLSETLGFCGAATLLLHEPFGKRALQSLLNLRADQIPRNNGDRFACLGRPVFLGKIGGDLAKDLLRFF